MVYLGVHTMIAYPHLTITLNCAVPKYLSLCTYPEFTMDSNYFNLLKLSRFKILSCLKTEYLKITSINIDNNIQKNIFLTLHYY